MAIQEATIPIIKPNDQAEDSIWEEVRVTPHGRFTCSCNGYAIQERTDYCEHIKEVRDHFSNVFAGAVHEAMRIADNQGESLISYKGRSYAIKSKFYERINDSGDNNLN